MCVCDLYQGVSNFKRSTFPSQNFFLKKFEIFSKTHVNQNDTEHTDTRTHSRTYAYAYRNRHRLHARHQDTMPGLTRQNSAMVSNTEAAPPRQAPPIAIAKAELLALKKDLQLKEEAKKQQQEDNDFAIKHSAVIKHIKLKHIAIQWINNTYDIIAMKQQRVLKKDAWAQCISPAVTPDPFLIQNPERRDSDCLWKPEFKIFANGEWFLHDDPITPPTSPQKNKKGKVFFGEEIEVAQREGYFK